MIKGERKPWNSLKLISFSLNYVSVIVSSSQSNIEFYQVRLELINSGTELHLNPRGNDLIHHYITCGPCILAR